MTNLSSPANSDGALMLSLLLARRIRRREYRYISQKSLPDNTGRGTLGHGSNW